MPGHVLVVDDNATVRKIVRLVLEDAGYGVSDAYDGQQALELVQRETFDLALIDFVMPKLNGYQLAQAMRSIERLRTLPIVLMSAKADQIGERFMRQTGAVDAITKPFSPDAIVAVVSHALQGAGRGETAQTLVVSDMHSQSSFLPPPPDEAPTSHDALAKVGATVPDLRQGAARVVEQAHALQAFSTLLARSVLPALAQTGPSPTESHLAEAISRTVGPADLARLASEIRPFDPDLRGPVALEGDLALIPLGEVLQMLRLQRQTGLFTVRHRKYEAALGFREGSLEIALARGVSSEFLLGRYLVADGLLTRADLERAVRDTESGGWLGERLMREGKLDAEQLERALTRQTSEIIYEMLRWADGRYRFEQGVQIPEAQSARLGLPVESIVLEGFRRVDEWRVIEQEVSSFDDVLLRDQTVIETVGGRVAPDEQRILEVVDGRRTVREVVVASAMSSFDGCRVIYRLLRSRLLRRRPG